eukprot:12643697-Alexandrium_andersonii.AAC.1
MPGLTSSKARGGGEEGGRGDRRCRCRLSGVRGWRPGAGEIGRSRGIELSGIGENTDGPLATHAAPDRSKTWLRASRGGRVGCVLARSSSGAPARAATAGKGCRARGSRA